MPGSPTGTGIDHGPAGVSAVTKKLSNRVVIIQRRPSWVPSSRPADVEPSVFDR